MSWWEKLLLAIGIAGVVAAAVFARYTFETTVNELEAYRERDKEAAIRANERSLLVRPASALPVDQAAAMKANGDAPRWEGKR